MTLSAVDYITETNATLIARGVPAALVTYERERRTGHVRRLSPRWSRSIGMWGGTKTKREISDALEIPVSVVHSISMFWKLKARTRRHSRTQAQLAILSLGTPGPAREVGPKLGILPIEVVLYRAACETIRTEMGVTLKDALGWTPDELEEVWHHLGLAVEHNPRTEVNYDDPAELDAVVRQAHSGWTKEELGAIVDLVRKELPDVDDEETATW